MNGYQALVQAVFRGPAHRHTKHCEQIDALVAAITAGKSWRQIAAEFDYLDAEYASLSGLRMLRAHGIYIDRSPRVVRA